MQLSGFADEASNDIDGQIKATKELGWQYIEARSIHGTNIHDISEKEFMDVVGKLDDHGIRIHCFGSAIANWSKSITLPFEDTLEEVKRAIPRMIRLGTRFIRIMSYPILNNHNPEDQMEEERFRRLRVIQQMFSDNGITVIHENCANYGGMGWKYTLKLLENVPGLKLVYDTGNPVADCDYSKKKPYPKQSSWEFYSHVKEYIAHMHIKDGIWNDESNEMIHTFPGEGNGDVRKIIIDLLHDGYDDVFSIEPHMSVVVHDKSKQSPDEIRYLNYIEYGRRFMKLLEECRNQMKVQE